MKLAIGSAALFAATMAASCGPSSSQPSSALPIPSRSMVSSARIEIELQGPWPTGGPTRRSYLVGAFDYVRHRGAFFSEVPAPGSTSQVSSSPPLTPPQRNETIILNGTTYAPVGGPIALGPSLPSLLLPFQQPPPGKQWVAVLDPLVGRSRTSSRANQATSLLSEAALEPLGPALDPSIELPALRSVAASATPLGSANIMGQRATEYRVIVSRSALAKAEAAADAGAYIPQTKKLKQLDQSALALESGPDHPIYIWLDSQARTVQIRFAITIPSSGQPASTYTRTYTYWDFGVSVSVQPPPIDQVASGSGILGSNRESSTTTSTA